MITYKTNIRILPAILCMLLCVLFAFAAVPGQAVRADEAQQSILDDFIGTDFDISEYPEDPADSSLKVVHIAETTSNELAVYVYQPSAGKNNILATSINIATESGVTPKYMYYALELLGSYTTVFKYIVKDLAVSSDQIRYYSISSISRQWLDGLDDPTGNDNTVSTVAYPVGQKWTAATLDGVVKYFCTREDIIEITDKYVGFLRYSNGFKFMPDSCDSHYVAFSTDIDIEYLYDADVEFTSVKYIMGVEAPDTSTAPETVTLSDIDTASNKADGWFAEKHEWNRIEKVSTFIANEDLTDESKTALQNKQWVLRFKETNYAETHVGGGLTALKTYVAITDVSILRLKFKSNGITYDLGVVDNKQSGSTTPGNTDTTWLPEWLANAIDWFRNYWYWLVIGVIGIVLLIIIMPFMPLILQAIVTVISWIFKGLWWLISAPFKWIYRKIRGT